MIFQPNQIILFLTANIRGCQDGKEAQGERFRVDRDSLMHTYQSKRPRAREFENA
jgi:hypothetical protein